MTLPSHIQKRKGLIYKLPLYCIQPSWGFHDSLIGVLSFSTVESPPKENGDFSLTLSSEISSFTVVNCQNGPTESDEMLIYPHHGNSVSIDFAIGVFWSQPMLPIKPLCHH